MADRSPAFDPPTGGVKDNDSMVVKVPMDKVDWANRKSQQPMMDGEATGPIVHVPGRN